MPPIFWVQKQDIGPSPRTRHGLGYDAARQRVVAFGGDPGGPPLGDTWEWDGNLWTQVADTGPSPRHSLSLTDHAQSQRLVLFGGANGAQLLGDTWAFDGTDWTQVADTGPAARSSHAAAYDPTRQRLVLFGGDNGAPLSDTWEWNGTDWTQVQDTGPSPRRGHAMAFDQARGRVILFGGAGANGGGLNDTWAWDGTDWTQLFDTGPEGRVHAAMSGGGSVLLFGGVNTIDLGPNAGPRSLFGDTWQLTAQGWTKAQDIGPAARWGAGAASRPIPAPARAVAFGGATVFAAPEDPALVPGLRSDTWEVPEPGGAGQPVGGQPQPAVQIVAVSVQPNIVFSGAVGVPVSVTVLTSVAPLAGTSPTVTIMRGPAPAWMPAQPPGFTIPPVTFTGASTTTTFTIVKDASPLNIGQYGVAVQIGSAIRVVGSFFIQL